MTRGFLLGKFMPPHQGHVFLCRTARALVDELTILVCWLPDDPVPGELRLAWMKEMFPECRVIGHDAVVPQEPGESADFWPIWKGIVERAHPEPIDVVFASEAYGERLAAEVGARFSPIDPGRLAIPESGTKVRLAPELHWSNIPEPVRPFYAQTVCLHGPESVGKSTLAKELADHFGTIFVPEYGRTYCDAFGIDLDHRDLVEIARVQHAMTCAALRQCNRLLFLDTDPLMTAVWSDMLTGGRDAWFSSFDDFAHLYLLLDIDLPWHDDGTRVFGSTADRARFFDASRAELDARGVAYRLIGGHGEERLQAAIAAVRGMPC